MTAYAIMQIPSMLMIQRMWEQNLCLDSMRSGSWWHLREFFFSVLRYLVGSWYTKTDLANALRCSI
ncbi:hypothetical protein BDW66DRAFT_143550 [Aspergillus desertorum]